MAKICFLISGMRDHISFKLHCQPLQVILISSVPQVHFLQLVSHQRLILELFRYQLSPRDIIFLFEIKSLSSTLCSSPLFSFQQELYYIVSSFSPQVFSSAISLIQISTHFHTCHSRDRLQLLSSCHDILSVKRLNFFSETFPTFHP